MITITVSCSNCNHQVQLNPTTWGNHTSLLKQLNDKFYVFSVDVETDVNYSSDELLEKRLANTDSPHKISDILDNEIMDHVYTDNEVKELRIDCKNCGKYIVLTDFY